METDEEGWVHMYQEVPQHKDVWHRRDEQVPVRPIRYDVDYKKEIADLRLEIQMLKDNLEKNRTETRNDMIKVQEFVVTCLNKILSGVKKK